MFRSESEKIVPESHLLSWQFTLLTYPSHMQVVYPLQKRPRHLQHQSSRLFERHGKVIGASSSDAGGDASFSNPGSAAAVATPKARVQPHQQTGVLL